MPETRHFADTPLLSAEVPYFRIPRDDWELMLVRARQLGAGAVATYVPWAWHEPSPGAPDLEGRTDPCRDLVGFVELCGRLGLRVILKPGPFTDAELLGGGVPPWLLRRHPEIHALRPDGQPWRHSDSGLPRACYLHPTYLAAARRWVAAFSRAALPLQAPAGPVVALQVDNETPGDGMLPADIGLDPRLRLDYNPHVTDVLWPRWPGAASQPLPRAFEPPQTLEDLRRYVALEAFTDWYHAEALATVAGWLREEGWSAPLFHDLLAAPWEAGGTIADAPGMARAVGWLGQNVYAEDVRAPFVGGGGYRLSWEEYVHFAHWRTRLARALSPGHPALVPEISAAQDFFFAAPLVGGAEGVNVYALAQSQPDNPAAAAVPRWAMEAPVRPDGSVRPRLWNAKGPFTLLGAAGADLAAARTPADVALGYSRVPERAGAWCYRPDYLRAGRAWEPEAPELRDALDGSDHAARGQLLAQRLVRGGVSFDVVDLDAATPADLAGYALLLVPACGVLARDTQRKLAGCANLALVGGARVRYDEGLQPYSVLDDGERALLAAADQQPASAAHLRLPADVSAATIADLAEARGARARHGWADVEDVDVGVRYGPEHTYLLIANRRPAPYSGTIAYRSPAGEVLHLHVNMGALRVGAVMLLADEVLGASFGGDGSEGGWLARGLFGSVVFSAGAGAVAPCGAGYIATAPQSGRFQLRRRAGWAGLAAHRLLLSGGLLPAWFNTEATHATLPYVAEDERGHTDLYLLLPADADVPAPLHAYLRALLLARAAVLRRLAGDGAPIAAAAAIGARAAGDLEALAGRAFRVEEYGAAWSASEEACAPAAESLARELARVRGERAAGAADLAATDTAEAQLAWALGLLARARLANDRE